MKINEISNINYLANVNKVNKVEKVDKEQAGDKVEISPEAKELSEKSNSLSAERIAEIKQKINENYYDREEILKAVAEKILHSPHFEEILHDTGLDQNI